MQEYTITLMVGGEFYHIYYSIALPVVGDILLVDKDKRILFKVEQRLLSVFDLSVVLIGHLENIKQ